MLYVKNGWKEKRVALLLTSLPYNYVGSSGSTVFSYDQPAKRFSAHTSEPINYSWKVRENVVVIKGNVCARQESKIKSLKI